jgi:hypothetical protein
MLRSIVVLPILLFSSISARATPINYEFVLTLDTVTIACLGFGPAFPCDAAPGDRFLGSFQTSTDVSGLGDGVYPLIPLDSWSLRIGDVLWDMNLPFPESEFWGFRDPMLGGINPGLIVSGGLITGFFGGVYGRSDVPFVDFDFLSGPGRFGANDGFGSIFSGAYSVHLISEPSTLYLLIIGLLGLALVSARPSRRYSA